MGYTINLAQAVDIGFVLTVCAACFQAVAGQRDNLHFRTRRWKEELRFLEETLRELIEEASAAGNSLNRSLGKRKDELQKLLQKFDEAKAQIEIPSDKAVPRGQRYEASTTRNRVVAENNDSIDVPNDSWLTPRAPKSVADGYEEESFDQIELDNVVETVPDTITLSRGAVERSVSNATIKQQRSALAAQIEKIGSGGEDYPKGFVGSSLDPTAYRIARRLLEAGKEIHVVARKLELPVAEVRLIDRMIRAEQGLAINEFDDLEGADDTVRNGVLIERETRRL